MWSALKSQKREHFSGGFCEVCHYRNSCDVSMITSECFELNHASVWQQIMLSLSPARPASCAGMRLSWTTTSCRMRRLCSSVGTRIRNLRLKRQCALPYKFSSGRSTFERASQRGSHSSPICTQKLEYGTNLPAFRRFFFTQNALSTSRLKYSVP